MGGITAALVPLSLSQKAGRIRMPFCCFNFVDGCAKKCCKTEKIAKVIEAEARGESYVGQVAVGAVVLNRVESASFPDSISGVVYQAGAFSAVTDSNWSVSPSATSRKAAQDAINGWDPSYGCLYYYNPAKTSNRWIRTRPVVTTIGSHVFCK